MSGVLDTGPNNTDMVSALTKLRIVQQRSQSEENAEEQYEEGLGP